MTTLELIVFLALSAATSQVRGDCASDYPEVTSFIEYVPGDTNIIFSVPHGGQDKPSSITPDRMYGCKVDDECIYEKNSTCATPSCKSTSSTDLYTIEIADIVASEYQALTGTKPYVIKNKLKRTKLDPNRFVEEAAQGDSLAIKAYDLFHCYINEIKSSISTGILFDFHGQAHGQNSTELGYLRSKTHLNSGKYTTKYSSVKSLANRMGLSGEELMAGNDSFGSYLEDEGFLAVPSPRQPAPGTDAYYSGGYITRYHGSRYSGSVDAIQLEMPSELRRSNDAIRLTFGKAIARTIQRFFNKYY